MVVVVEEVGRGGGEGEGDAQSQPILSFASYVYGRDGTSSIVDVSVKR